MSIGEAGGCCRHVPAGCFEVNCMGFEAMRHRWSGIRCASSPNDGSRAISVQRTAP
jgi:hypothetical protein